MKSLLPILFFFLCLSSCQSENETLLPASGTGYLELSSLDLQSGTCVPLATRAVDSDLNVDILSADGKNDKKFMAGSSDLQQKILLPAGTYTLIAYTGNFSTQSSWTDADKGEPVYYGRETFTIEEDKITYFSLQVPMVNYGVTLSLPEEFDTWFSDYTFQVQAGGRTVELKDGETAYFPLSDPELSSFTYSLSATNQDGETMDETPQTYDAITAGTVYKVTYNLATRSLCFLN